VRIRSGQNAGWGEASPGNAPVANDEWAAGAFQCLRDWLAPALAGASIDSGDALQKRLAVFRGNRFAKAALDLAWWDLRARGQGKPLHELLGGKQEAVEVGVTFDQMDTIDDLLSAMHGAVEAGFGRIGLKFRPGWDVQMLNFVRHEIPVQPVHIDCEGALRLDHMEMICRLDDFGLSMVEQPLAADDLVGHAMIQETIRTPLCLDEGVSTVEQADMALELHSCKWVKIEPGRVGGLTPAMAIYDTCHTQCTPCWIGAPVQTAIGQRAGIALAAKPNCTYPAEYIPPEESLAADVAAPAAPVPDGPEGKQRVRLWLEPGLGVEPDEQVIDKFCLSRASIP